MPARAQSSTTRLHPSLYIHTSNKAYKKRLPGKTREAAEGKEEKEELVEQDPHRGVLRQSAVSGQIAGGEHDLTGRQRHRRHTEIGVAGETASVRAGAGVRDHVVSGIDGRSVRGIGGCGE